MTAPSTGFPVWLVTRATTLAAWAAIPLAMARAMIPAAQRARSITTRPRCYGSLLLAAPLKTSLAPQGLTACRVCINAGFPEGEGRLGGALCGPGWPATL